MFSTLLGGRPFSQLQLLGSVQESKVALLLAPGILEVAEPREDVELGGAEILSKTEILLVILLDEVKGRVDKVEMVLGKPIEQRLDYLQRHHSLSQNSNRLEPHALNSYYYTDQLLLPQSER
jgi:hypothetical protein